MTGGRCAERMGWKQMAHSFDRVDDVLADGAERATDAREEEDEDDVTVPVELEALGMATVEVE